MQSEAAQSEAAQSEAAQSEAAQSEAAQSEDVQSEAAQSEDVQREAALCYYRLHGLYFLAVVFVTAIYKYGGSTGLPYSYLTLKNSWSPYFRMFTHLPITTRKLKTI